MYMDQNFIYDDAGFNLIKLNKDQTWLEKKPMS